MFKGIFTKLFGKSTGAVADFLATEALDKATGGVSTAVEKEVERRKAKRKRPG